MNLDVHHIFIPFLESIDPSFILDSKERDKKKTTTRFYHPAKMDIVLDFDITKAVSEGKPDIWLLAF